MAIKQSHTTSEGITTKGVAFKKGKFSWFRAYDIRCVVQGFEKNTITHIGDGHEVVSTRRDSNSLLYIIHNGGGIAVFNTEGEISFRREKMRYFPQDLDAFQMKEAYEAKDIPIEPQEIALTYTPNLKDAFFTGDKLELNVLKSIQDHDFRKLEELCKEFATKNRRGNFDGAYTVQKIFLD